MRCPECGYALPDDSEFCQYCGKKLNTAAPVYAGGTPDQESGADLAHGVFPKADPRLLCNDRNAPPYKAYDLSPSRAAVINTPRPTETVPIFQPQTGIPADKKTKICKYCGGIINPNTKKCSFCGRETSKFPGKVLMAIAISLLVVVLAGVNIYQYMAHKSVVEAKDFEISDRDHKISSLDSQLSEWKEKAEASETKANTYQIICDFLAGETPGYASNSFKASEEIIVISKTDARKTFTLTSNFYTDVNIQLNTDGGAADVEFSESSFYGSTTTIYVTPNYTGTTIATFTNDLNSQTFQVLIVVTD